MEESDGPTTEGKVGISEYLSKDVPGFRGVLKHRYSDFHVNEVDMNGKIIRFGKTSMPKVESAPKAENMDYSAYGELPEDVKALFSPLTWSRLTQMSKKYAGDAVKPSENESIRIDVTSRDKDSRRQTHETIKKNFPNLNSNTEDEGKEKFIVISYIRSKNRRNEWPSHRPQFLHFTLCKVNMDTFTALSILSKRIFKRPGQFSVAGTKDKRGITAQRVSARFITAETISRAIKLMKGDNILTGDYSYETDKLRLGDLSGNHFKIALRDVDKPLEEFEPALENLKSTGFINYFGLQRFGTSRVPTSSVGLKVVERDWEGVVEMILKPRENEKASMQTARKIWSESKDASRAMKVLAANKGRDTIEFSVLRGLSNNPSDFVGALSRLGRSMKSIYPHAYQSLIWNEMVSRRIQQFGTKVLLGDLVQVGDPPRHIRKPSKKDDTPDEPDCDEPDQEEELDFSSHIQTVNETNINDFTIYDVVMTQPGHDVRLPDNEIKSWYEERLSQDGLKMEDLKNTVKDFDLPGGYRKMIVRPKDVAWRMLYYSDKGGDLLRSDQDVVKGIPPIEDEGPEGGKFKALILDLTLPTSSYATMALREVTKEDTSISVQSSLTDGINEKRSAPVDESNGVEPKKIKLEEPNCEKVVEEPKKIKSVEADCEKVVEEPRKINSEEADCEKVVLEV